MEPFQLSVFKFINLPTFPPSFSLSLLLKDMSFFQLNIPCIMNLILFYVFGKFPISSSIYIFFLFYIIYLSVGSFITTFKHILPSFKKKSLDFLSPITYYSNSLHFFIVKHLKNTHLYFLPSIDFLVYSLLISTTQWKLLLLSSTVTPVSIIPVDVFSPHFIWLFSCSQYSWWYFISRVPCYLGFLTLSASVPPVLPPTSATSLITSQFPCFFFFFCGICGISLVLCSGPFPVLFSSPFFSLFFL